MEGWLKKKPPGAFKGEKKRFFKLKNKVLTYSETSESPPLHSFTVSDFSIVNAATFQFKVSGSHSAKSAKGSLDLTAGTAEELKEWEGALTAAVDAKVDSEDRASDKPKAESKAALREARDQKEKQEAPSDSPSKTVTAPRSPRSPRKKESFKRSDVKQNHTFEKHTFKAKVKCMVCGKMMFGSVMQGVQCTVCNSPCHHGCVDEAGPTKCELKGPAANMFGGQLKGQDMAEIFAEDTASDSEEERRQQSFLSAFSGMARLTKPALKKIWRHYDKDNSGELDPDELRDYLKDLAGLSGGKVDEDMVKRVMAMIDVNGDGLVQFDEFLLFYDGQRDSAFLSQFQGTVITEEDLRAIWNKYDDDNSGSLDKDELKKLFQDLLGFSGGQATSSHFAAFPSFWDPEGREARALPLICSFAVLSIRLALHVHTTLACPFLFRIRNLHRTDFDTDPLLWDDFKNTLMPIMNGVKKSKKK